MTIIFVFSKNKLASKFMELIQEISEDKKLTVFLEKRYKEYERDTSCSEAVQYYKDEIEVYTYKYIKEHNSVICCLHLISA